MHRHLHGHALLHTHMHAPTTQKGQQGGGAKHSKKMQLPAMQGALIKMQPKYQRESEMTLPTQNQPTNHQKKAVLGFESRMKRTIAVSQETMYSPRGPCQEPLLRLCVCARRVHPVPNTAMHHPVLPGTVGKS